MDLNVPSECRISELVRETGVNVLWKSTDERSFFDQRTGLKEEETNFADAGWITDCPFCCPISTRGDRGRFGRDKKHIRNVPG